MFAGVPFQQMQRLKDRLIESRLADRQVKTDKKYRHNHEQRFPFIFPFHCFPPDEGKTSNVLKTFEVV